jgi:hypothetical protein
MDFKLDYTQPVNIKSINLGGSQTRDEVFQYGPLELNIVDKSNCLEKENKPASMNEINYPSIAKIKSSFYETEKFESLKILAQTNFNT